MKLATATFFLTAGSAMAFAPQKMAFRATSLSATETAATETKVRCVALRCVVLIETVCWMVPCNNEGEAQPYPRVLHVDNKTNL